MQDKTKEAEENRRPLMVRQATLALKCSRWLSNKAITPNQISVASIGFAILAAFSLLLIAYTDSFHWLLALSAAIFIQCRLLCNLFDGMVAVEGGKSTPSGELFNDIPDRIADPIILIAVGYAAMGYDGGISLGWLAGLLALMTAYIRTLAASIDAPVDFQGPMAKQHRMAVITVACISTIAEDLFFSSSVSLLVGLIVVVVGCLITCYRRIKSAYYFLERRTGKES